VTSYVYLSLIGFNEPAKLPPEKFVRLTVLSSVLSLNARLNPGNCMDTTYNNIVKRNTADLQSIRHTLFTRPLV
jgi:hypothetical protein